jgi:hypothetical protein
MPLVNFSDLEFSQIKDSIKDYLRANSNFTDYDFEGSNLSTIIDTLAYNTYITSYNANMVTNEVFIDSATLRENVVSLARNIGYVPRSKKASYANVTFTVDASATTAVTVTLKAGSVMTSTSTQTNKSKNFIFSILNDITVPVNSSGQAVFSDIKICEGTYITQPYTVDGSNPNQKFILPNTGIDTGLLSVVIKDTKDSTVKKKFTLFDSLFDVNASTRAYFLQEIGNENYELLFGDGVFGEKLQDKNYIEASYIVTSGPSANSIERFKFIGNLESNNGDIISSKVSVISTEQKSIGGKNIESVASIKKYAPQIYASQNRAVTAADYEALIPKIYPEAESVSAFGGEDLTPPLFGKVFISIKPYNGIFLSSSIKENLQAAIKRYSVAGILTEIVDLKYLYIEADSEVYYDTNNAPSKTSVQDTVTKSVVRYSDSIELNSFGARFKYSKFQNIIDNSSDAVTSNITNISMRRDMAAQLNTFAEYELCFGNRFHLKNHGHGAVYDGTLVGYNIKSSGFQVAGINGTVYLGDKATGDLTRGSLFLFRLNSPSEPIIVKQNIGTIDYKKGEIKLNPINIISTQVNRNTPLVEVSAAPYSNDVIGLQDLYLQLDVNNTTVDVIQDNIASGNDVSGSNYIVSPSYTSNVLVRGTPVTTVPELSTTNITTTNPTSRPSTSTSSSSSSSSSSSGY